MLIICFISTLPITGIKYTSDRLGAQIKWTGDGTPDNLIHCSAEGCGTSTSTTYSRLGCRILSSSNELWRKTLSSHHRELTSISYIGIPELERGALISVFAGILGLEEEIFSVILIIYSFPGAADLRYWSKTLINL